MTDLFFFAGVTILCYLYGAIPFAFIATYFIKRERIYELGSKNVGVANTFSVAGTIPGVITVIGEISKAIVPIVVSYQFFNPGFSKSFLGFILGNYDKSITILFVGASFIGTNFSIFIKFRGGMGNTINMWALLLLAPISLLATSLIVLILGKIYKSYTKAIESSEKTKYLLPIVLFLTTIWTTWRWSFLIYGTMVTIVYFIKRKNNEAEIRLTIFRTFHPRTKNLKAFYKKYPRYIYFIEEIGKKTNIGNKAFNISLLNRKGFHIPESIVITYEAFNAYNLDKRQLLSKLKEELSNYVWDHLTYAVRSSANKEDESEFSFAGQFQTFLDVKKIDDILNSIIKIWDSALNTNNQVYNNNLAKNQSDLQMGIIIQKMIIPQFSGVMFTRDPVYNLNKTIIEVVGGVGRKLVQDGINPERWINKWGQWLEIPDRKKLKIINKILIEAKEIEKIYGEPVDLEFVYDGKEIFWLQLRSITTTKDSKLYSNKISKEFLPGMIKPLIFSINIPVVNSAWKKIFQNLIGHLAQNIKIIHLAKSFYYRVYFNMGIIGDTFQLLGMPRDLLEILAGIDIEGIEKPKFRPTITTFRFIPRMIIFGIKLFLFSKQIEIHLRKKRIIYDNIKNLIAKTTEFSDIFAQIEKLLIINMESSYYVIISQLLNSLYTNIVRNRIEKAGYDFEKYDFSLKNPRIKYQDFRYELNKLHKKFIRLEESDKNLIRSMDFKEFKSSNSDSELVNSINKFLNNYGFLRESGNDFSTPTWDEFPDLVLKMVTDFEFKKTDNYSKEMIKAIEKKLFRSPPTKLFYQRSIKYQEYRDSVNKLYMYGYGLFRPFFLKIGNKFVEDNFLVEVDDIFYLEYSEIKSLVSDNKKASQFQKLVVKRKYEMEKYKNIQLPNLIYDDNPPEPIEYSNPVGELKGVATSKGIYSGLVKIVNGIEDYDKIKEGDILVVPYSDVSWTPMFAKAKAVISESGGILSHCSIVAREYKIPAVVSVDGVMNLKDNTKVLVNGFTGKITIIREE